MALFVQIQSGPHIRGFIGPDRPWIAFRALAPGTLPRPWGPHRRQPPPPLLSKHCPPPLPLLSPQAEPSLLKGLPAPPQWTRGPSSQVCSFVAQAEPPRGFRTGCPGLHRAPPLTHGSEPKAQPHNLVLRSQGPRAPRAGLPGRTSSVESGPRMTDPLRHPASCFQAWSSFLTMKGGGPAARTKRPPLTPDGCSLRGTWLLSSTCHGPASPRHLPLLKRCGDGSFRGPWGQGDRAGWRLRAGPLLALHPAHCATLVQRPRSLSLGSIL